MAGEWIKVRGDLLDDPAVFMISKKLGLDRFQVVGRLVRFWTWADKLAVDGVVDGVDTTTVDAICDTVDFGAALVSIKWLELREGSVYIPNWERHNGENAKTRSLKSERQARWRKNKVNKPVDPTPSTKASTGASTREEKNINTPIVPKGTRVRFSKPSREMVWGYGSEIGLSKSECEDYYDYQESKGWKVGSSPMKDWNATLRRWKNSPFRKPTPPGSKLPTHAEAKALAT
jgi:hypothetical protein